MQQETVSRQIIRRSVTLTLGRHEGPRLIPATSTLKSLHEGTGRRDLSHQQFTQSVLRNKSQGLVPKFGV